MWGVAVVIAVQASGSIISPRDVKRAMLVLAETFCGTWNWPGRVDPVEDKRG